MKEASTKARQIKQSTLFDLDKDKYPSYEEIISEHATEFTKYISPQGKFYPRVVRTLINAFRLSDNSLLLDPFKGIFQYQV
jgi:tRNA G10  N-methylase Trm11